MIERFTHVTARLRQFGALATAVAITLCLSLSPANAEEIGPLAPEGLRCEGFVNAEATRPGPE